MPNGPSDKLRSYRLLDLTARVRAADDFTKTLCLSMPRVEVLVCPRLPRQPAAPDRGARALALAGDPFLRLHALR